MKTENNMENTNINIETEPENVYKTLLDELYETINENYDLFENNNIKLSKPDISFDITRKTVWKNFNTNCSQINRSPLQLQKFINKEFNIESRFNIANHLLIRGRYTFPMLSTSLKKYIKNFVQCSSCKSIKTEIIRDSSSRLDYIKCLNEKCNTQKALPKI